MNYNVTFEFTIGAAVHVHRASISRQKCMKTANTCTDIDSMAH